MRIFLTGATGYIGAAVLDALVRGGHDVTALVRDNGESASRGEARRPSGDRRSGGSRIVSSRRRRAGRLHSRRVRCASGTRGRRSIAWSSTRFSRRRGVRGPPGRARRRERFVIYTSGVWVLGSTRRSRRPKRRPSIPSNTCRGGPPRAVDADANSDALRTVIVRPGVVYGGGSGIVGDLFKSASNGLVRVVGDGNNHWPLVYDRDLADLYARLVAREDAAGVYHANDEGDERVNDIVSAIKPHLAVRPDVRHVPIDEARAQDGHVCRCADARSGGPQPAGAGAGMDAEPAFGGGQRRAAARRVARRAELRGRDRQATILSTRCRSVRPSDTACGGRRPGFRRRAFDSPWRRQARAPGSAARGRRVSADRKTADSRTRDGRRRPGVGEIEGLDQRPRLETTRRSIVLLSSRTLPGHGWRSSASSASVDSSFFCPARLQRHRRESCRSAAGCPPGDRAAAARE